MRTTQENPPRGKKLRIDDWAPLASKSLLNPLTLAETLNGGQSFRWFPEDEGDWLGVAGQNVAVVGSSDTHLLSRLAAGTSEELSKYLACDVDWTALADNLPWRSDIHLARCIAAFPGLRILRQPFDETLLCFMCSATKQIVQIQEMVRLLAERFGARLSGNHYALPTWERLSQVSEVELRECKLGFRAKNVASTAALLKTRRGWLEETAGLPYPEAKSRLIELPGVGAKIADCVLLFGAGRLEAFPVDIWILRAMQRRYQLDGWSPEAVTHFGRVHFGPLAGLAQQYLFAWERRFGANEP